MSGVAQIVMAQGNPWNPLAFKTDLSFWLDAQDATTIVISNTVTNTVSQWNDKSGNGINATQTTSTRQPIYSATSFVGGLPGITYDGVDDWLRVGTTYMQGNTTHALYYVVERVGNGSGVDSYRPWIGTLDISEGTVDRGGAPHFFKTSNSLGASYPYYNAPNTFSYDLSSGTTYANGQSNILCFQSNVTGWGVWRNGTLEGTTNGISNPNTNNIGWVLGRMLNPSRNVNCRIVEVIGVKVTTTLLRQQVEGYLAWKWRMETNLPATHPYRNARPTF